MENYTKQDIINIAKQKGFIDTDGILYDLKGDGMAAYLKNIGFTILKNYDTGRNGLVITEEGIKVSTNGYCSLIN
jgi:hypothetical protein